MSDREMRESGVGILSVARREIRRIIGRPLYPMLLVVLPLLGSFVLCTTFVAGVPRDLPVAVVDADNSALSRRLVRMIDATAAIRVAERASSVEEAKDLVLSGRAYALVVIPPNVERDVRAGRAPKIVAFVNSQYLLPASVIGRDLRRAVATLSAGVELRVRRLRGATEAEAMAQLEPVRVDTHNVFNPELNYAAFLLPALIPTLIQIFIMMAVIFAAGSELRDGTAAEWIAIAGDSTARAMAGKLLPYFVQFTVLTTALEAVVLRLSDRSVSGSSAVLAAGAALFVLACCGLSLAIVGVTSNLRFGLSAGAFFSGPAFAFSGVTFPTFAMPLAGRAWGAILPLTHYVKIVFDEAMRGASLRPVLVSSGSLALIGVITLAVAWATLRLVCRNERRWGKL